MLINYLALKELMYFSFGIEPPIVYIEGLELKPTISIFLQKCVMSTFRVLSNHTLRVRILYILYLVKDA